MSHISKSIRRLRRKYQHIKKQYDTDKQEYDEMYVHSKERYNNLIHLLEKDVDTMQRIHSTEKVVGEIKIEWTVQDVNGDDAIDELSAIYTYILDDLRIMFTKDTLQIFMDRVNVIYNDNSLLVTDPPIVNEIKLYSEIIRCLEEIKTNIHNIPRRIIINPRYRQFIEMAGSLNDTSDVVAMSYDINNNIINFNDLLHELNITSNIVSDKQLNDAIIVYVDEIDNIYNNICAKPADSYRILFYAFRIHDVRQVFDDHGGTGLNPYTKNDNNYWIVLSLETIYEGLQMLAKEMTRIADIKDDTYNQRYNEPLCRTIHKWKSKNVSDEISNLCVLYLDIYYLIFDHSLTPDDDARVVISDDDAQVAINKFEKLLNDKEVIIRWQSIYKAINSIRVFCTD